MKKLNIFFTLCLSTLLSLEDVKVTPSFQSGMPLPSKNSSPIVSQSTRNKDRWRFTIGANFNEYQATADSMELGYTGSTVTSMPEGRLVTLDFDYKPGFEVRFILDTPYDDWNFGGGYLWFRGHSNGSAKAKEDTYYYSPIFINSLDNSLANMSADWYLDIDLMNIYLSRPFFSGRDLSVIPILGLSSGWIRQDLDFTSVLLTDVQMFNQQSLIQMCG